MHILVVDDQEQERYLLKLLLESAGHQVSQAADGQAALEQARTNKPQVIISDLLMPRLDGYALLYTMRHDPILQDVPLVFYTATFTDEDDRQLALNLGASRFLVKPDALNIITDEVSWNFRKANFTGVIAAGSYRKSRINWSKLSELMFFCANSRKKSGGRHWKTAACCRKFKPL
jgi:CheY-like chemotaxis protein